MQCDSHSRAGVTGASFQLPAETPEPDVVAAPTTAVRTHLTGLDRCRDRAYRSEACALEDREEHECDGHGMKWKGQREVDRWCPAAGASVRKAFPEVPVQADGRWALKLSVNYEQYKQTPGSMEGSVETRYASWRRGAVVQRAFHREMAS